MYRLPNLSQGNSGRLGNHRNDFHKNGALWASASTLHSSEWSFMCKCKRPPLPQGELYVCALAHHSHSPVSNRPCSGSGPWPRDRVLLNYTITHTFSLGLCCIALINLKFNIKGSKLSNSKQGKMFLNVIRTTQD